MKTAVEVAASHADATFVAIESDDRGDDEQRSHADGRDDTDADCVQAKNGEGELRRRHEERQRRDGSRESMLDELRFNEPEFVDAVGSLPVAD